MTPEQEDIFRKKLEKELVAARIQGMISGISIVSNVVYEKVVNVDNKCTKDDLLKIIKSIKEFCEKGLNTKSNAKIDMEAL